MSVAPFKLAIVVNEPSADVLAASMVRSMRGMLGSRPLHVRGMGGAMLEQEGCEIIYSTAEVSSWGRGIFASLRLLARLRHIRNSLFANFTAWQPDVFVGVDASDFNLALAYRLRQTGIRTVQYVSPSVGVWRSYRASKVARAVDLLLALYPYEKKYYDGLPLKLCVTGHPLADSHKPRSEVEARAELGLSEGPWLGVMFGSRSRELDTLGVCFAKTAALCHASMPQLRCITSVLSPEFASRIEAIWQQHAPQVPLRIEHGRMQQVISSCDVVLLFAGTITLEAMFLLRPMVMAGRIPWVITVLLYLYSSGIRDIVHSRKGACLPNIMAGRFIVPEFILWRAQPQAMAPELLQLLHTRGAMMKQQLAQLVAEMPVDCSSRAAAAVLDLAVDG